MLGRNSACEYFCMGFFCLGVFLHGIISALKYFYLGVILLGSISVWDNFCLGEFLHSKLGITDFKIGLSDLKLLIDHIVNKVSSQS